MKTFGELLTEYMIRTGISDSEMARHLGISRQTIFRWKEGLTARPRVREDVLNCADRLRLTAAERDALLLSAGFAPEVRAQTADDHRESELEASALTTLAPAGLARMEPPTVLVPQGARGRQRSAWLVALLLLLIVAGLIAGFYFLLPNQAQGVIALVVSPTPTPMPTPTATPVPPPNQLIGIGQFNSRGGQPPPYDVTARLRQALESEIQAQNLAGARLLEVADSVRDEIRAEQLRTRDGSEILVWGNYSGDNTRAEIGSNPRLPLVNTGASVVPILPRDQSVTLDMRDGNQTRALALAILLPLHFDREGGAGARATLQDAQGLSALSAEMRAALAFYQGYLAQTTEPRNLQDAIRAYDENLKTTSLYEAFLNRGLAKLSLNQDDAAQADFAFAREIGGGRPEGWRATCWTFALEQQPQAALPYCQAATERDATGWSLDTRGIVYAELGRYADAANELENFLHWTETQPPPMNAMFAPSRRAWIDTLRAEKNPFDAETLKGLRGTP